MIRVHQIGTVTQGVSTVNGLLAQDIYTPPMRTLFDLLFLSLALWLAAWRLLGDRNGWLALLNAWAWWLLCAALPAGAIALGRRSGLAGLLWGSGWAALWLQKYGWMLIGQKVTETSHLTLLTFNLLNNRRELTPLLRLIEGESPDLLLLQECIESHAAQLDVRLARVYPHRLWLPAPAYGMGFGLASRLPFALTGYWAYPGFEPFAARITLPFQHPNTRPFPLDIYCVQFISPTNEVRRVGPTSLLRLREGQIAWVLAEIAQRKRAAVVAGDWNTTESTDAYGRAASQLVDGWREAGNGPGWSWPASLNPFAEQITPPVLRLDYLMHTGYRFGDGLAVAEMRVIRAPLGSDHCPLLARLVVGGQTKSGKLSS